MFSASLSFASSSRFPAALVFVILLAQPIAVLPLHAADVKGNTGKAAPVEPPNPLMETMNAELHRAMSSLGKPAADEKSPAQPAPYFLSYVVTDAYATRITAQYGALLGSTQDHSRVADIQVRVGTPALDNTHGDNRSSALSTTVLPLTDDHAALARALWFATNRGYGSALQSYLKVKTDTQVRAREEDTSPDFSFEPPRTALTAPQTAEHVDQKLWEQRLRELSASLRPFQDVFYDAVVLTEDSETDYFVSSEGTQTVSPLQRVRLIIFIRARAEDGMDLFRIQTYEAASVAGLPDIATVQKDVQELGKNLEELRNAPITQPFNGPAILSGRAAAVFFHEVLGHRLEGERQRGDEEGQTFTKELGKPILPSFLSIADDPTLASFNGTQLSGHYLNDDEGQPAQRVELIKDGVLKTFLMSRLPIASFSTSNGHGRAQTGRMPTGRQGNLIVTSTKTVSDEELRSMLIAEAKKQGKPYGLYFEDISSGFAVTTRQSPQAFSVIPLVVYRVYVDGRPDELVRGVSIVGTPRAALKNILAAGSKPEVFNGECGAESGTIPVSAIAPAMLVSEIETQKQEQGTTRPPILPPPSADDLKGGK